jgi:hypothetical protein
MGGKGMATRIHLTKFTVSCVSMFKMSLLLLVGALLTFNLCADTIDYQVTALSTPGLYQFTYVLNGFSFVQGQILDIQFDPNLYGTLSDPVSDGDFDAMVLQPNSAPGAPGDYLLTAQIDNPSLAGPFSVDFTYAGSSVGSANEAGAQPFSVYSYTGPDGFTLSDSGNTETAESGVPEPASLPVSTAALLVMGAYSALRRRLRGTV